MTDTDLLRRFADDHSQSAFAELVGQRVDLVYATALRRVYGDVHLAQDVTQIVFTDLARKAGSLCRHPALAAWLHASTHYTAAKLLRTERRRAGREKEAEAMREIDHMPENDRAWDALRPVLDDALLKLRPRDRQALLLRYLDGRPLARVGTELGISENAAQKAVDRALEKLRPILARSGIASTTAALGAAVAGQAALAAPAGLAGRVAQAALFQVSALAAQPWLARLAQGGAATKLTLAAAALVIAVGVGGIAIGDRARHSAEDLARRAERMRDSFGQRLTQSEERAHLLQAELDRARGSAGAPQGAPGAAAVMDDTEIQKLLALQLRNQVHSRYSRLFEELGLAAATRDQLEHLLVESQLSPVDVALSAMQQGVDPAANSSGYQRLAQETAGRVDQQIRTLLGAEHYGRYLIYRATLPERIVVERLAQILSYGQTPLDADSAERLVRILAAYAPAGAVGLGSGPMVFLTGSGANGGAVNAVAPLVAESGVITEAALTEARAVLLRPQWDALCELERGQRKLQDQMNKLIPSTNAYAH